MRLISGKGNLGNITEERDQPTTLCLTVAHGFPLELINRIQSFSIRCQKKYNQVSEINICLDWERQIDTKNSYLKITSSSI